MFDTETRDTETRDTGVRGTARGPGKVGDSAVGDVPVGAPVVAPAGSSPPTEVPADVATGVAELSTQRLEADICTLAGHLAAATCRWVLLLAEFDRREAWASFGARSCAHWLSWRCGMSGGTAREHVRVGQALVDLPLMRAEFAAGRLTYSKVRAMTRIATPALEAELVQLGLGTPAGHVERIVRGYRRALDLEQPPVPSPSTLTRRWDDDGSLTVTVRLGADEGALVVAALEAYGAVLDAEQAAEQSAGPVEASTPQSAEQLDNAAAAASSDQCAASPSPGAPANEHEALAPECAMEGCQVSVPAPEVPEPEVPGVPDDEAAECEVLSTRRSRGPVAEAEALLAMVAAALTSGPTDRSGADRFQVVLHADLDQLAALTRPGDPLAPSSDAAFADATGRHRAR